MLEMQFFVFGDAILFPSTIVTSTESNWHVNEKENKFSYK